MFTLTLMKHHSQDFLQMFNAAKIVEHSIHSSSQGFLFLGFIWFLVITSLTIESPALGAGKEAPTFLKGHCQSWKSSKALKWINGTAGIRTQFLLEFVSGHECNATLRNFPNWSNWISKKNLTVCQQLIIIQNENGWLIIQSNLSSISLK